MSQSKFLKVCILFVLPLLGMQISAQENSTSSTDPYLGKLQDYVNGEATVQASINVLGYDESIAKLVDTVDKNLQADPEWFKEYTSNLQQGEVVPYHQNFGVSESEYQLVVNAASHLKMRETGTTELKFSFRSDETFEIAGLPGESPFDGVIYESVSDSLISAYGTLKKSAPTSGNFWAGQEWQGRMWTKERVETDNQVQVAFVIGSFLNSDRRLLMHEVNGTINGESMQYHYVLFW